MRRFIRTFTVKRHAQFTVVQDGDCRVFVVLRWDAGSLQPLEVWRSQTYAQESRSVEEYRAGLASARAAAVGTARRLAAEAGQSLQLGEPVEYSDEEIEAEDECAAAAGQALSPAEQEARRR